jgi:hypothetical protein
MTALRRGVARCARPLSRRDSRATEGPLEIAALTWLELRTSRFDDAWRSSAAARDGATQQWVDATKKLRAELVPSRNAPSSTRLSPADRRRARRPLLTPASARTRERRRAGRSHPTAGADQQRPRRRLRDQTLMAARARTSPNWRSTMRQWLRNAFLLLPLFRRELAGRAPSLRVGQCPALRRPHRRLGQERLRADLEPGPIDELDRVRSIASPCRRSSAQISGAKFTASPSRARRGLHRSRLEPPPPQPNIGLTTLGDPLLISDVQVGDAGGARSAARRRHLAQ